MTRTSPDSPANERLREMARQTLGSGCEFTDFSRNVGRRTITWLLTASDGTQAYLKRHEHRKHHAAEVLTLSRWAPLIESADWWSAPAVLTSDDELGAVILSALPGETLDHAQVTPGEREEAFRLAGRFASLLHVLDADPRETGRAQVYDAATREAYLRSAAPHLHDATKEWIRKSCAGEPFAGLAVVPAHVDYSPRNWLIDRSGGGLRLGVIDWERARAAYWIEDVQRLESDYWVQDNGLRSAFFEGYGRAPTARESQQLDLIVLLNATATLQWALDHGDRPFFDRALATIERLKAGG